MADKKFYEDSNFWIGAGIYYLMQWVLTFYPAFTIAVQSYLIFKGEEHLWGELLFCVVLAMGWAYIVYLLVNRFYKKLIFFYLVTLTPFISYCRWMWATDEYGNFSYRLLEGLDWIPLLFLYN